MTAQEQYNNSEFFPTPYELCVATLEKWSTELQLDTVSVLDPGAGDGTWGKAFRELYGPYADIYGLDIRDIEKPERYDYWERGDYLKDEFFGGQKFDLIMGNPPYSLVREFIEKSYSLLNPDGYLVFLTRLAFLEGQDRYRTFWPHYTPKYVYVLSKRPSFTQDGRTDTKTAYSMIMWQKDYEGEPTLRWLMW